MRDYEIRVTCNHCRRKFVLKVEFEDYMVYDMPNRPKIQEVFPYLAPGERELLISNTCSECWDKMFDKEEII